MEYNKDLELKRAKEELEAERKRLNDLLQKHRETEYELAKSREDFRLLFENSFDAIFIMEIDGKIIRCNSAAVKLFGYSEEELLSIGRPGFADKSDTRWPAALKERLETGKFTGVLNYIHKNGNVIPGETSSQIFRMNDGTFRISTVIRDVTARIEAERKIQENQKRFERAEALAKVGSWMLHVKSGQMDLSEEFTSILGLEPDRRHILVNEYLSMVHPEDRENLTRTSSIYHKERRPLDIEYRIIRPNGVIRYIHGISGSYEREEGGEAIRYGAAKDVTETKLQELELLKTLDALERSNKDLEQFAYVASHDLQEPLRMVSTYSTMLERNLKDTLDEKSRKYLEILIESSKRMHSLINGLLDFSRINSEKEVFASVDLNNVVNEVLKDLSYSIMESKAEIRIDKLPLLKANQMQMKQLFQNLISNAIKFRGKTDLLVEIKAERKSENFLFSVKDNGIGINPDFFERIFVIFQRLHNRETYQGTGIGLSICKRIVEHHGGRIWVESKEGCGASFFFTLPANR